MTDKKLVIAAVLIIAALALAAILEVLTWRNVTFPSPPAENPFPAGTYFIHVFNVGDGNQAEGKDNVTDGNVTWQWRGWNDTWVWIDDQPKMLVQHDDIFPTYLKPNERIQINYFGWHEYKIENVTYWFNYSLSYYVYWNGLKGLGPWHVEAYGSLT